jgi:hypothetical protein
MQTGLKISQRLPKTAEPAASPEINAGHAGQLNATNEGDSGLPSRQNIQNQTMPHIKHFG